MNKKGFTLVELLAVIAILSILVIIALPNVMNLFNEAKKNSFTTEIKNIYKSAQQQWMTDSMFETKDKEYGRCNECNYNELKMDGRTQIQYYIKINKAGKVVKYKVNDGTYQYSYSGDGLLIEDITSDDVLVATSDNLKVKEYYYTNGSTKYNTYQEVINASGYNYFLRREVEDDKVVSVSLGFIYNSNVYYLYINEYEENKELLNQLGISCNQQTYYTCRLNGYIISLNGSTSMAQSSDHLCIISTTSSYCRDD